MCALVLGARGLKIELVHGVGINCAAELYDYHKARHRNDNNAYHPLLLATCVRPLLRALHKRASCFLIDNG